MYERMHGSARLDTGCNPTREEPSGESANSYGLVIVGLFEVAFAGKVRVQYLPYNFYHQEEYPGGMEWFE